MIRSESRVTCDACGARSDPYPNAGAAQRACVGLGWALQRVAARDRWGRPSTRTEHVCPTCREAQGRRLEIRELEVTT